MLSIRGLPSSLQSAKVGIISELAKCEGERAWKYRVRAARAGGGSCGKYESVGGGGAVGASGNNGKDRSGGSWGS